MAWPKGTPRKPKAAPEEITAAPEPQKVEIAPVRTMRYHKEEPPRIFQAGDEIPEGWTKINTCWRQDRDGNWIKESMT